MQCFVPSIRDISAANDGAASGSARLCQIARSPAHRVGYAIERVAVIRIDDGRDRPLSKIGFGALNNVVKEYWPSYI